MAKETVALHTVVTALERLTDEQGAFLNPSTGEVVILTNDELYAVEREDESASLELTPDRIARARAVIESEEFVFLPTCFDYNEQRIKEDFCASIADESVRRDLLEAMAAEESAQRFSRVIRSHGLEERWSQSRRKAIEALAAAWLEKHGIPFTREAPGGQ